MSCARPFTFVLPALLAAAPAPAQTFEEAVLGNAALALQLCLSNTAGPATAAAFRAAGFAERVERSAGNSDTTHHFSAPADTVSAKLYYGEMPDECTVSSDHLGLAGAAAVLDAVVPRLFPSYVRKVEYGPLDPATGQPAQCVRYEDPANPIGDVIGVATGGDAGGCVENGTSQIYRSSRV